MGCVFTEAYKTTVDNDNMLCRVKPMLEFHGNCYYIGDVTKFSVLLWVGGEHVMGVLLCPHIG